MSESTTEMTGVMIDPVTGEIIDQKELAERLLAQAKEQGVGLVGPGGASMVFVKLLRADFVVPGPGRGFRLGAWRRARLSGGVRGR
ncbi:hypothetical protein QF036_002510 [Arthrobacter globiformis]|nr:hypothetical protein [Arthrobacter globiformis]